ncbi:hypothetical protein [Streptomyces sp. NPDC048496]|uniref:hypothetical protein n=1 Tax=Streptomyces sp. NPDC048496 TaxID=3365558 RepID=UPI00371542F0
MAALLASLGFYGDGALDDAGPAYSHYRENTGADFEVNYNEGHHEDEAIGAFVDGEVAPA